MHPLLGLCLQFLCSQPEMLPGTRRPLRAPLGRATCVQSGPSRWQRVHQHPRRRLGATAEALRSKKRPQQPHPPVPQPEMLPGRRCPLRAPPGQATCAQSGPSRLQRVRHPWRRLGATAKASHTRPKNVRNSRDRPYHTRRDASGEASPCLCTTGPSHRCTKWGY